MPSIRGLRWPDVAANHNPSVSGHPCSFSRALDSRLCSFAHSNFDYVIDADSFTDSAANFTNTDTDAFTDPDFDDDNTLPVRTRLGFCFRRSGDPGSSGCPDLTGATRRRHGRSCARRRSGNRPLLCSGSTNAGRRYRKRSESRIGTGDGLRAGHQFPS